MASGMDGTPSPVDAGTVAPRRLVFLDGIRALAALFVVGHHIYITVYPGFPENTGPWFLGWLLYGHFGVAIFIVVSGFSLTLAPARRGNTMKESYRRFIERRAWRIIPPYWAALVLSVVLVGTLVNLRMDYPLSIRGILTHFFLVQDIFSGASPNGAFWSIAIEWQLYFFFPLFIMVRRRLGGTATAIGAALGAFVVYQAAVGVGPLSHLLNVSPQLAALFVFGIVAAGVTARPASAAGSRRSIPWGWISLGLWVIVVVGCARAGSVRIESNFYWADLVVGAAVATGLAALAGGPSERARRVLETGPLVGIGHFSYSLYLIHGPLLLVGWLFLVQPLGLSNNASFALMVVLVCPPILAASYGFFLLFERPFLNHRSWAGLRESLPTGRRRAEILRLDDGPGAATPASGDATG